MTKIFVINDEVKFEIKALMIKAKRAPITMEFIRASMVDESEGERKILDLKDRKPGFERPPSQHILIPHDYRASYSVEEQPPGLCAHLSISVDTVGMLPNPFVTHMIMQAFEIDEPLKMWFEEFEPNHHAVNIIGLLK